LTTLSRAAGDRWPSLGVVVPVYNEADGIERSCREIMVAVGRYRGRCALIAVDDGSADGSPEILAGLDTEFEAFELVRHPANAGYGQALRTGAAHARSSGLEYVAFIDSDLTNPPLDLLRIGELAREGHRYIKASRFVAGGDMSAVPFSRRSVSKLGNLVAAALFGTSVRDVTNGFRAGETDLICSWPTRERGFAVIVEEFAYALSSGVHIAEFPTVLTARVGEQRASAFSYSAEQLMTYLRYPLRYRIDVLRRRRGAARA
jgi:glycosyltransferase involved in cell wall biosynthesis